MSITRKLVIASFGVHVAYGAAMLAAPGRVGARWTGRPSPTVIADVPLRGIGGREVAMHAAGAVVLLRGASLRPWLLASLGGDITDITSSLIQREQLPDGGLRAVLLTGGGSALWTVALLVAAEV